MNNKLRFINDTYAIGRVFHEPSMHKTAQDGIQGALSTIEGIAKEKYDSNRPVESILAFIGPGLLWMLGFKWIAALFAIAEALGFDWKNFFSTIKEKLRPFLTNLIETKSGDTSEITNIVQDSAQASMSSNMDVDKLQEAVEKYSSVNNMLFTKQILIKYAAEPGFKLQIEKLLNSTAGNRMRSGILGFIIRIFSWILSAVLISLGFAVAGGVASKILGIKKDKPQESTPINNDSAERQTQTSKPNESVKLVQNQDAPSELFATTYNDDNHVWLVHYNISQIKDQLIHWAQELYPQLKNKNAFEASQAFNHTLSMIKERNKDNQVDLIAIPQPFTSIKSIVDSFVADVASHEPKQQNNNQSLDI